MYHVWCTTGFLGSVNSINNCRSVGKHSSLGGPQRLNRVDLYGKNLIPMEKLSNLGANAPLPPVPTPMINKDVSGVRLLPTTVLTYPVK